MLPRSPTRIEFTAEDAQEFLKLREKRKAEQADPAKRNSTGKPQETLAVAGLGPTASAAAATGGEIPQALIRDGLEQLIPMGFSERQAREALMSVEEKFP